MQCLILCGGRGVIDPKTFQKIPKAFMKIGNKPLVWHIMKIYANYGFKNFILALGDGSDIIKQYFINSNEYSQDIEINLQENSIQLLNKTAENDWTIKLIDTGNTANTGARIARCKRYLKDSDFFLTYSDILANIDLPKLIEFHQNQNKTLTVCGVTPPTRFGIFTCENNKIINYTMHQKILMNNSFINGGFMIANKKIFNFLSPINDCNLEVEILAKLVEENELSLYKHTGFWHNVDTERDIEILQNLYQINQRPWLNLNL